MVKISKAYGLLNGLLLVLIVVALSTYYFQYIGTLLTWSRGIVVRPPTLLEQFDIVRLSSGFYLFFTAWLAAVLLKPRGARRWRMLWRFLIVISLLYLYVWQHLSNQYIYASGAPIFFDLTLDLFRLAGGGSLPAWQVFLIVPVATILIVCFTLLLQGYMLRRFGNGTQWLVFKSACCISLVGLMMALLPSYQDRLPRDVVSGGLWSGVRTAFAPRDDVYQQDDSAQFSQYSLPVHGDGAVGKNVVILLLESTRADALSRETDYLKPTTPFLDELSKNSLYASNAYTVFPYTSKAITATLCGIVPFQGMEVFENLFPMPVDCLPTLLSRHGYETVYFQSPTGFFENRRQLVTKMGFAQNYALEDFDLKGFEMVNYLGFEDDVMLEPSRQWHENNDKPFLAVYLTGATHHPYSLPSSIEHQNYVMPGQFNDYLNTVNYLDSFAEKLIAQYKQAGLYENTIFLILGDHGEGFGEHASRAHGYSMFNEVLKIPLIIHAPGLVESKVHQALVSQLDVVPTLMELLGLQAATGFEGKSLLSGEEKPVYATCLVRKVCLSRIDEKYKYIFYFGDKSEDLFAYREDEDERVDLAEQQPELVAEFRKQTFAWYQQYRSRYHAYYSGIDPNYMQRAGETFDVENMLILRDYIEKEMAK